MPHRDIRYFISTIYLKANAQLYDWAAQTPLLLNRQQKQIEAFFLELYAAHFSEKKIELNASFSKQYVTYNFFSKATDLEQDLRFNTEGVPLCHLDAKKIHVNQLVPAYFGLICYNDFLVNGDVESLEKFWIQVHHLDTLGVIKKDSLLFMYEIILPLFEVKPPWFSGITQALIASTFIRAFDLTKNDMYKQKARQSIEAMFVPLEAGGVFGKTLEGFDWIEEYPSVSRRSMVLNGFIFSIIAVYEYLVICGNDAVLTKRLPPLIESLFKTMHHYIRGRFVKYGRDGKILQNINYQGLIVFQFLHLYQLSGNQAFRDIALLFNKNVNWAAYFRYHKMPSPPYFEANFR